MPETSHRRLGARALVVSLLGLLVVLALPTHAGFDQAGYDKAINTILCDCGCHPQSVHACACGRAAEMRADIRKMIVAGMTGDQVIGDYVARFGEKIRVAPVATGFNLVAWIGPLLGLVLSAGVLLFMLRRWQRLRAAEPVAAEGPALADDDPYLGRLRRELEERE